MKQNIQVIIISDFANTVEVLKLYLQEYRKFSFLASSSDLGKAYNAVKELEKSVVIVDISDYQEQKLNFISKISSEFPQCKVVALSDKPDVDLVIRTMRTGASDFVSMPVIKEMMIYLKIRLKSLNVV